MYSGRFSKAMLVMSCIIFWVVLRRMVFNSRRFGTLCLLRLHTRVDAKCVRIESCVVANRYRLFLISNFRRVLNLVHFLLGISPASE
jgi:hypothetical protein